MQQIQRVVPDHSPSSRKQALNFSEWSGQFRFKNFQYSKIEMTYMQQIRPKRYPPIASTSKHLIHIPKDPRVESYISLNKLMKTRKQCIIVKWVSVSLKLQAADQQVISSIFLSIWFGSLPIVSKSYPSRQFLSKCLPILTFGHLATKAIKMNRAKWISEILRPQTREAVASN